MSNQKYTNRRYLDALEKKTQETPEISKISEFRECNQFGKIRAGRYA